MEIKHGLQFITSGETPAETARQAILAIEGGCRWVQVRMKDATDNEITEAVEPIRPVADKNNAIIIIDDRVHIAKKLGLSGVHLGKNDMSPAEARLILGEESIIGATANTLEDIEKISLLPVDYIGLGPFRFTTTKKNLSPVLGLDGYKVILSEMRARNINLPVVAIGGITLTDIGSLMKTGINGVAVSGAISRSDDIAAVTATFINEIKKTIIIDTTHA